MTQERFVAAGKYGRKQAAGPSDAWLTDRVDGWVEEVKPAGGEPAIDRAAAQAKGEKLTPGNHPMLPRRQLGDHLVGPWLPPLAACSRPGWLLWFIYLMKEVSHSGSGDPCWPKAHAWPRGGPKSRRLGSPERVGA